MLAILTSSIAGSLSAFASEIATFTYTGSVDFPDLFKYNNQENANLETALISISHSFNDNSVPVTQELLAAILATLDKEIGKSYLPVEEEGDYGAGSSCTYKIRGSCRSTPYDGGVDYKGRGYIQITGKDNYQMYCGSDCVGTSEPQLDVCGCKDQWYCTDSDATKCPQVKALQPDYAAKIFASYYIKNNLVSLSNAKSYLNIGKVINGDNAYASDFNTKANAYLTLFRNNPEKTNTLLAWLNSDTPASGASKQVTLTLYVHDGNQNGPVVPGVQITGQDGSGNSFQQATDSNGSAAIRGDLGTWSFNASASGYESDSWSEQITGDCTRYEFLQKIVTQLPSTTTNPVSQPEIAPVTLTLYVHEGSASGPIIPGAKVTANVESDNSFQGTTNANGFVTITGTPGTWSFTASADGYVDNPWNQQITSTCKKDAVLQKIMTQQPSVTTSPQPAAKIKPVTLILYVNNGEEKGPAIPGALVTGQDESGNSFHETTGISGSVIISGNPGTWSFTASASGYETKSWSQPISDTCAKHAFLQKVEKPNAATATQEMCTEYPDKCLEFVYGNKPNEAQTCYESEVDCLDQALSQNQNNSEYWYHKGNALHMLNRYDDAIRALDIATELDPKLKYAWNEKGVIYKQQGNIYEANKCFNKAMEIDPNWSVPRDNI